MKTIYCDKCGCIIGHLESGSKWKSGAKGLRGSCLTKLSIKEAVDKYSRSESGLTADALERIFRGDHRRAN